MSNIPVYYLIVLAVLIAASILSKYFFLKFYSILKLLPMAVIIFLPIYTDTQLISLYGVFVLSGLLFSLAGDFLLLWPDKYFRAGLISFLIAHVFYSCSFYIVSITLRYEAFVLYALYAYLIYKYLKSSLDKLKIPVIIYITVISVMGALGMNQFASSSFEFSFQIFAGSLLFIISDTVLAINKFKKPFKSAELIILSTYYFAQLFFAASV